MKNSLGDGVTRVVGESGTLSFGPWGDCEAVGDPSGAGLGKKAEGRVKRRITPVPLPAPVALAVLPRR